MSLQMSLFGESDDSQRESFASQALETAPLPGNESFSNSLFSNGNAASCQSPDSTLIDTDGSTEITGQSNVSMNERDCISSVSIESTDLKIKDNSSSSVTPVSITSNPSASLNSAAASVSDGIENTDDSLSVPTVAVVTEPTLSSFNSTLASADFRKSSDNDDFLSTQVTGRKGVEVINEASHESDDSNEEVEDEHQSDSESESAENVPEERDDVPFCFSHFVANHEHSRSICPRIRSWIQKQVWMMKVMMSTYLAMRMKRSS